MEAAFYPTVCARLGVAVVTPDAAERAWVHERYVGELLKGEFRDDTRRRLVALVRRLRDEEHVEGVILGGTELPLLLPEPTIADLPALDTTALHVTAIVERLRRPAPEPSAAGAPLGDAAVQRFLDGKQVAILATARADGAPLATPMWFLHDPAVLTMISVAATQKVRNLRRDPRVCVVAESAEGGVIRGVTVLGRAELLADGPERRALAERFHAKYPGLARLWNGRAMPADRVMFRIVPRRVRAWGLG
jgi:PPOX class probable F420-dependent enzyme